MTDGLLDTYGLTRRSALLGALAAACKAPAASANLKSQRVAAIDWAAAETLISIGIVPAAIADIGGFRSSFSHLPEMRETLDLGSVWEPNLELLDRLKPDLIYLASWSGLARKQLETIAPVRLCDIYGTSGDPIAKARAFAHGLQAAFPQSPKLNEIARLDERLSFFRSSLRPREIFILNLRGNNRFVNVYSTGSLPGSALTYVGLQNAWQGKVNGFGFAAIGIEKLIEAPESAIIILDQKDQTARLLSALSENAIWRSLPAVRSGRVHVSPPVSIFGGLASATTFSEWLVATFDA